MPLLPLPLTAGKTRPKLHPGANNRPRTKGPGGRGGVNKVYVCWNGKNLFGAAPLHSAGGYGEADSLLNRRQTGERQTEDTRQLARGRVGNN